MINTTKHSKFEKDERNGIGLLTYKLKHHH